MYEATKRGLAHLEGHGDPRNISANSKLFAGGFAGMFAQCVIQSFIPEKSWLIYDL